MRIALDVDGVLADLLGAWLRVYQEETGRYIERSEVDSWEFWAKYGITRSEFMKYMIVAWSRWWEITPLEEDMAEDVDNLSRYGDVDIVTQRPAKTVSYVKKWLDKHGVKYRRFTWVPPRKSKSEYSYDVYIDDSPRLAEELQQQGRLMLLYNQPWNSEVRCSSVIKRVNSLDECADQLEKLVNGGSLV